jgi:hypothetical protein
MIGMVILDSFSLGETFKMQFVSKFIVSRKSLHRILSKFERIKIMTFGQLVYDAIERKIRKSLTEQHAHLSKSAIEDLVLFEMQKLAEKLVSKLGE